MKAGGLSANKRVEGCNYSNVYSTVGISTINPKLFDEFEF